VCSSDLEGILAHVIEATHAVQQKQAAYERDGVLFNEAHDPYPLLAMVMRIAAERQGAVRVLDFGGALGSHYWQCRDWLKNMDIQWCVVEQPMMVEAGRKEFASDVLHFAHTMEEAAEYGPYDLALFSGVLQYLPDPWAMFREVIEQQPGYVMIDRTPVIAKPETVISVQSQSGGALPASSYPIRLFAEPTWPDALKDAGYQVFSTFDAMDPDMGGWRYKVRFKGWIAKRQTHDHA